MSIKKIERNIPLEPLRTLVGSLMGKYKGRRVTFQIYYGNVCLPVEYIDGKITHLKEATYINVLRQFLTTQEGMHYIVPDKTEIQQININMLELEHNGQLDAFIQNFYGMNQPVIDNEAETMVAEENDSSVNSIDKVPQEESQYENADSLKNSADNADANTTVEQTVESAENNAIDGDFDAKEITHEEYKAESENALESTNKVENLVIEKNDYVESKEALHDAQPIEEKQAVEKSENPWAQQAEQAHHEYIQVTKISLPDQTETGAVAESAKEDDDLAKLQADANDKSALDGKTVELHALTEEEISKYDEEPLLSEEKAAIEKTKAENMTKEDHIVLKNPIEKPKVTQQSDIEKITDIDMTKIEDLNVLIRRLFRRFNDFVDSEEERFYVPTNLKPDDGSEERNLDMIREELIKFNDSLTKIEKQNKMNRNFQIVIVGLIILSVILNYLVSSGMLTNIVI